MELWIGSARAGRRDRWTTSSRPGFPQRFHWAVEAGAGSWDVEAMEPVALELARELAGRPPRSSGLQAAAAKLLKAVEASNPELGSKCRAELERAAPGWAERDEAEAPEPFLGLFWNMHGRDEARQWARATQLAWREEREIHAASASAHPSPSEGPEPPGPAPRRATRL